MSAQLPERMDAFVAEILREFSADILQGARERVAGRNIVEDRELLNSLATHAMPKAMELLFAEHGRMHDMGAGKGYRKGQYIGDDMTRPHPGHKPSKWYSRFAYGMTYGRLVNDLSNRYLNEVAADLKKTLTDGTAN